LLPCAILKQRQRTDMRLEHFDARLFELARTDPLTELYMARLCAQVKHFRKAVIAAALVVGAASEQQIVADYSSLQVKTPADFWAELKQRKLIEQDAPVPV
jgi:hypothetical protein